MIVLGFDPGGARKFGCAFFHLESRLGRAYTAASVDDAVGWIDQFVCNEPIAYAGIDTLLFWQSTASGWRGADEYLRQRYPHVLNSVLCANGLYGSMAVQGAVLAQRLREKWPTLCLTETHPKVLWKHFNPTVSYPRNWQNGVPSDADAWMRDNRLQVQVSNEHEFDALISAWAAENACKGFWNLNLFDVAAKDQKHQNVKLIDDVYYFWPK